MNQPIAGPSQPEKPKRLYFKSYLAIIHNSIGSHMFKTFYVQTKERGQFDALDNGLYSCAFYVSSVLVLFKKLSGVHATVQSTLVDLKDSGWVAVKEPQPGDVLVWEAVQFDDGPNEHIGFSVGQGRAISTSYTERTPVEHDQDFGGQRKIIHILRVPDWD